MKRKTGRKMQYTVYLLPVFICAFLLSSCAVASDSERNETTETIEISETGRLAFTYGDCPSALQEEREWADRLEDELGITILISSQCDQINHFVDSDYVISTTEGIEQEKLKIRNALYTLDKELHRYPKGFFRQMRSENGDGGVVYCLTGEFTGSFPANGLSDTYQNWYPVCLDITQVEMNVTLHHETFHVIESYMDDVCGKDAIDPAGWMALNPPDFEYSYSYYGWNKYIDYTFLFDDHHPVYFFDCYSKIEPREDRARLFECLMCPFDRFYGKVLEYEHIIDKINFMAEAIRTVYNTDGWEDVVWEQWLP